MLTHKDSETDAPAVAPIFVQEALACARKGGVNMDRLLADAGLVPSDLADLNTRQFGRIWLHLSYHMQDEFFGLGMRPMRPGSTTLLGHAIRGAPTVGAALNRALRFLQVVLDDPHATTRMDGRSCCVELHQTAPLSAFAYRTFFLIVHGFTCWTARERIPLSAVDFPCPEPQAQNDYGDFFGVPVRFNAPSARMVFDRKYLTRSANRSEADLKRFLRSLPEAFLRGYRDTEGLKHVIIKTCLNGPATDWPDASAVAERLGMSRSTLHRLLKSSGHSLTDLKDEQRRNRATALLSRTSLTVTEVSAAVGYADEAAFYRAFQRWYGTTPRHLRMARRPDRPNPNRPD